jgi:type I restriction enzyme S subunit
MVSIKHGFAFKGVHFSDSPTPDILVTPGNFAVGGGFKTDKLKFYDGPVPEEYELKKDDLVVTMTDLSKQADTLGYSALIPEHPSLRFLHNQRVGLVALKSNQLDKLYLYFLLRSQAYRHHVVSSATGSTVKHTSPSKIVSFEFRLPPIETQKEIGSILKQLEDKALLNHQINQTLEQMAQAIFKSWFVDFEPVKAKIAVLEAGGSEEDALLAAMQVIAGDTQECANVAKGSAPGVATGGKLARLQAEQPEQYATLCATAELFPSAMQESELGEIPEGWDVSPISELFELHRGFDLPQKSRKEGSFEVYAAGGLHGTHSQFKMEPPGIITGRSGVIGNVYLSLKKYWPLNTTLYVRQFRACGPYYAYHLLKSLDLKALNSGSAVPSLNRNFVHSTDTIKPNSELLAKFEHTVGSFFQEIVGNIDQNESLGKTRDTLFPMLLSGELTIPNAENRVAEAKETTDV